MMPHVPPVRQPLHYISGSMLSRACHEPNGSLRTRLKQDSPRVMPSRACAMASHSSNRQWWAAAVEGQRTHMGSAGGSSVVHPSAAEHRPRPADPGPVTANGVGLSVFGLASALLASAEVARGVAAVSVPRFEMAESAQVITAVSAAVGAVCAGVTGIIRAYATLLAARGELARARLGESTSAFNSDGQEDGAVAPQTPGA